MPYTEGLYSTGVSVLTSCKIGIFLHERILEEASDANNLKKENVKQRA